MYVYTVVLDVIYIVSCALILCRFPHFPKLCHYFIHLYSWVFKYQLRDPKDVTAWSCSHCLHTTLCANCRVKRLISGRMTLWQQPQWNGRHVHWNFWCWFCGADLFSQRFQDVKHWPKRCETWALLLMVSWFQQQQVANQASLSSGKVRTSRNGIL